MVDPIRAVKEIGQVGDELRRFAHSEKRQLKKKTSLPTGKTFQEILEEEIERSKRELSRIEKEIEEAR